MLRTLVIIAIVVVLVGGLAVTAHLINLAAILGSLNPHA
jgi:hypothetical protein